MASAARRRGDLYGQRLGVRVALGAVPAEPAQALGATRRHEGHSSGSGCSHLVKADNSPLVLDHPGPGTVEAVSPAEPEPAAVAVSAVGVAVVDDAAELVPAEHVSEGRRAHPADLPDTEGARCRRHREWVRRDRPTQGLRRRLT
jgi:hypothetical protein